MKYLLLTLALTARTPAVIQSPPVVIVTLAPVLTDPRLDVRSATLVTVTLHVALTTPTVSVWLRSYPVGRSAKSPSPAGEVVGLSTSLPSPDLQYLPGLSVEVITNLITADWTVAALTQQTHLQAKECFRLICF